MLLTARQLTAFKAANLLEASVKLVFGSFYSLRVYEFAESLAIEALNSGSIVLEEHAKQLLSAGIRLASFQTLAVVNNCFKIEFTLILVETSNNLLSALFGYFLRVNVINLYSAHEELFDLFDFRLKLECFHDFEPSAILFDDLRL